MASDESKTPSQLEKGLDYVSLPANGASVTHTATTSTESDATLVKEDRSLVSLSLGMGACVSWFMSKIVNRVSYTSQEPGRLAPTRIRKLEEYPNGFPKVARFLDSDHSFSIYRRFGTVYSRLLLAKQDQMVQLESALHMMDKTDEAEGNGEYLKSHGLDARRDERPEIWTESRPQLMEKMEKTALEYADLLLKARQLKALDRPTDRDYKSVIHFMENDPVPLFEEDGQFIYEKEDLVSLRPGREHAWLDGIMERILRRYRCRLVKFIFCTKETEGKTDDEDIHYYDRDRISMAVTLIISTAVLCLLVIPIWLLYRFSVEDIISTSPAICVVLVFTFVFSACITAFTKARRHEIVAASAGYCAVLVVFLGNVNAFSH